MDYLFDKEFLKELDNHNNHEIYVRVIALTVNDEPIEMIEGRATGGSVNIDGTSAIRRTCSVSLIANDININDFYWGLNNKFKLEIGLKNYINPTYPDIIWFKQGTYVITSFNTNLATNSFTISISGKDKMCLLNGDIGGSLPASIDFGVEEYYDKQNNITTRKKIPIKTIIREMIHSYALEPYYNIIINDLDAYGLELLEYRCDTPMYLLYDVSMGEYIQYTYDNKMPCVVVGTGASATLDSLEKYNARVDLLDGNYGTQVRLLNGTKIYTVSKVEYGQTAGYRLTDLTYPDDLISSVGESITSILDKIVKMLGNFEYFYDLDGRFIFQKKKTYIDTAWSPIVKEEYDKYVQDAVDTDNGIAYYFHNGNLIKSFQNTPNLNNLKNDYAVWGMRKGVSSAEIPVHYRYAIHKKPERYVAFSGNIYDISEYNWRELIYQMANDYYLYGQEDDYVYRLMLNNPDMCRNGYTGYEQFYTDMQGFWRDLYDPTPGAADYDSNTYWNKEIQSNPDRLNFWIDFLDSSDENGKGSELDAYSISAIGDRSKVVNDTDVKSIYFRSVPNLIFTTHDELDRDFDYWTDMTGYTFAFMDNNKVNFSYFTISTQGKSAKEALDELIYNHSYCIETINLSCIPIYYLQPNTRISVVDDSSKINGEYLISRITIPLNYNGTMSIAATKAPSRI